MLLRFIGKWFSFYCLSALGYSNYDESDEDESDEDESDEDESDEDESDEDWSSFCFWSVLEVVC
jgi:hypothetical protein